MHIFLEKSEKFFSFMNCENRNLNLHEKKVFENEKLRKSFFFGGIQFRFAGQEGLLEVYFEYVLFLWCRPFGVPGFVQALMRTATPSGTRLTCRNCGMAHAVLVTACQAAIAMNVEVRG